MKVQLNNYQAENGRNGGAMISIVTKSGTKDYRGSAYVYKRDEKLNANDFFNNRNGIAKPLYRYTTLGATLGGPMPGRVARQAVLLLFVRELGHARAAAGPAASPCRRRSSAGGLLAELHPEPAR